MLPIYEYNGTLAGNLLENTDVINALNSSDSKKPLSAAQGNALNNKINALNNKINTIKFTEFIASNDDSWKGAHANIDDYDAFLLICTTANFATMLGSITIPRHSVTLNNEINAFYPPDVANYEVKMKFTTTSNVQVWTKTQYDGCVVYGLKLGGE